MNIRHVQVSLDKMKKFANEKDKTQYDYDYVIISSTRGQPMLTHGAVTGVQQSPTREHSVILAV